jgi:hypothetical protein
MSSRRELLKLGTLAGVSALIPGAAAAARLQNAPQVAPGGSDGPEPSRQQLQAQVNSSFYVARQARQDVRLVLVEVSDPALSRTKAHPECFGALFRGPATAPLAQGTYMLVNRWLGQLELFLVPVGPVRKGMRYYEASFNRAVPEGHLA